MQGLDWVCMVTISILSAIWTSEHDTIYPSSIFVQLSYLRTKQFDIKECWSRILLGFTYDFFMGSLKQQLLWQASFSSDRKMYWTLSVETLRQAIFALLICTLNKNDSSVHLANCMLIISHWNCTVRLLVNRGLHVMRDSFRIKNACQYKKMLMLV